MNISFRIPCSLGRVGWLSTFALAAFLLAIKPAHGQFTTRTWQGAADGNWNSTGNWSGSDVPNSNTEAALINGSLSGGTPVVLNLSPAIGSLTIASGYTLTRAAADAGVKTLTVSAATAADTIFDNAGTISSGGSSSELRVIINNLAGTIANSGTMEATAGTSLVVRSSATNNPVTITNTGGVLRTVGSGTLSFADTNGPIGVTGGSISNAAGTISHRRTTTLTDVTFTNGGIFTSDAPTLAAGTQYNINLAGSSSLSNTGTMSFTKDVSGTSPSQSQSLQITGATASLTNSGSMYFATIGTATSGFTASTQVFVGVSTTVTNNGFMTVESRSDTNATSFNVGAALVSLAGTGTLTLAVGTGGAASQVRITGGSGSGLVNGASHTIRGAGAFGSGGLETFTNNGTLNADGDSPLTVLLRSGSSGTFTNSSTGVVRASGTGGLVFSSNNQFTNEGLAQVDAGSLLALGTAIFSTPGHLKVNGSLTADGPLSVAGTLSGTGVMSPAVTVAGILAPGNSIGTLSTGTLTLGGASTFDIELGWDGLVPVNDRTAVTGGVTIDSGANLALTLFGGLSNPFAGDIFYLIENDGVDAVSGEFTKLNGLTTTLTEGSQFSWNSQDWLITYQADVSGSSFTGGNDVAIMVVPEPGALVLAAVGIAAAAMARRRVHG